jgi:hypothetical protein
VLRSLVEETYELVEIHLLEVDVERLRTLFRSDRRPLEALPKSSLVTHPILQERATRNTCLRRLGDRSLGLPDP